jgi:hypothetical protein
MTFVFLLVMKTTIIHYQWRLLCGEVPSLVAFFVVWLFFCWSFDGGLSSNGVGWK